MSDDLDLLRNDPSLTQLLASYSPADPDDRERWHDRRMARDGVEPRDLSRLHGTLLAFAWLEQNTGQTPSPEAGQVRSCYRLTIAGRRALRQLSEPEAA